MVHDHSALSYDAEKVVKTLFINDVLRKSLTDDNDDVFRMKVFIPINKIKNDAPENLSLEDIIKSFKNNEEVFEKCYFSARNKPDSSIEDDNRIDSMSTCSIS